VSFYCKRAYEIGRELKLTSDENFEEALNMAKQRDVETKKAKQNGTLESLPLLHGIPFSVKDMMDVKGLTTSIGKASLLDREITEDSHAVRILRENGGIPFVKTNNGDSYHTNTTLYGEVENPWNRSRTCGGSSGGCAGLVASNSSPISLATDLAGSIRVPASFCGLVGFVPTA
jgi:amidase